MCVNNERMSTMSTSSPSTTMEAATNDPPSNSSSIDDALPSIISPPHLAKGKLVNVISRTWPGINKPGGIGKIIKIYTEESTQLIKCVDVKYIVHGGTDKVIPVEFIEPHEYDGNRHRNKSERCKRCKSFRSDCLSCDLRYESEEEQRLQREEEERRRLEEEKGRNDDGESMDSEEEEAYIAAIEKRHRRMCRQAKRRSNAHTRQKKKKKKKKQQNGNREEGHDEDTDSDEENETLGALIKQKKKFQRKKMKRRRQLQKPSVLASLPQSTTEPNVSVSNKIDCGKSVKEDDRGNGADNSKLDGGVDEEEMEFDLVEENINQAPIENDTDDDESADSDDEDNGFIERNNDDAFEDQEASSDESDDSDDDDVKLIDLANTDKTDVGIEDDGQDQIKNIINDLLNTTIPYASAELSHLKGVLTQLKRSMAKNDCLDEIDELAKKADALHKYVVEVLIRNGADKCSHIMTRLTKKKKRRAIAAKMSKSERSRYYQQIDALDLRIDSVGKSIEDVDADVTNFQKEVDKLLDEAESNLEDFFLDSHTTSHNVTEEKKRKSDASEKEWNPHQHASHKRKSSKSYLSSQKRAKSMNQSRSRSANASAAQHRESASGSSQQEKFNDDTIDFDISSDVEIESSEMNDVAASKYQSIDDDCIGETDDLDNGPAIKDTSRSWHNSSSKPPHKEHFGVQRKLPGNRRASSNKRSKERVPTYRHIRREGRSGRKSLTTNSAGAQSRQSQVLVGMDRGSDTNRLASRESQRTESLHSTRKNLAGQRQPHGRSSTRTSSSSQRGRVVQNFLKPENLFNSLSTSIPQDSALTRGAESPNQIQDLHSNDSLNLTSNTRPLNELCTSLRESHSQGLDSCRETLSALSNSSPSGNEEVITLFQTLHTFLKVKCSTLLDALNCDPQLACLQMDCWSIVFRLMEQNHQKQLPKADVLWKVFGDSALFARHVLLQIIDVLFSQLMGDGYGDAPRLTDQLFGRMRSLCRQIGRVVPILPELPNLLRNLPGQLWYQSLIYDQKENTIEKALHVSMLDPKVHRERFMIEGAEVVESTKENRRIDLYNKNLPRQEINAIWTTIGFFADASPIPSKKKEKMLAVFVQGLLQSKYGVLSTNTKNTGIPANDIHLDRCLHEIKWVCHLLSKSLLGELSFPANFVPGIVKKAILLESTSVILHMRPTAPQQKVDRFVTQLWKSSCLGSSDEVLGSLTFNSLLTQSRMDDAWCHTPSTNLAQACASLIEIYAVDASKRTTKAYWNNFSREVDKLASSLAAKAKEADMTVSTRPASTQTNGVGASFAHLFPELESFSEKDSVSSRAGAFLRETACFSLLACVIASTRSAAFVPTPIIALNKCFREKITNLSSDECMQEHHKYYQAKTGDAPKGTSNINLLFVSSKVLSLTTLLHLSVTRENVERVGLDDDISMLEYLTFSIISNLSASIDNMKTLNLSIKETRNLFNSSISCNHVIKSTAMWLGLIFDRATMVIRNVPNENDKLRGLHAAIKKLAVSTCSSAIAVLTKALSVLFDTASTNKLGKSLNVDLALDKAFHCCLGAIRKVICLVHACREYSVGEESSADAQCNMVSVFSEYQNFMALKVIPTTIGIKKSDAQDLCCRQSVGLLCVLAALCSTCSVPQTLYQDIFRQREKGDDSQLIQLLRATFSCELTRLATRGFSKCLDLAMRHFGDVLNDTIVSMFDYQSITSHPTSNTDLLLKLGGEISRRKGTDKLKKTSSTKADDFGYKEENFWSLCTDIGNLFHNWNPGDGRMDINHKIWINSVGRAIQSACAHICTNEDGDSPHATSAEKECDMRRELLRSIFTSMKQENLSFGDLPGDSGSNVRSIFECIKRNVFFLSKTVSYYEEQLRWGCEDDDSIYKRAEIRAYEEAYVGFCASVLSDMLEENGRWVNIMKDVIVKVLESPCVDRTEKEIILKLLSRVFEEYSHNGLGSVQKLVEVYCAILHTLKTCLCDLFAARSGNDAIKHIFSCALHIVKLQGKTTPNDKSTHAAYINAFTNWLNICGMLMQEEDLVPEMCREVAKLNNSISGSDPLSPKFTILGEAFKSLRKHEDTLFPRAVNPYAKQRVPSNAGQHLGQNLKLSHSCLKTVKNFTDEFGTSKSVH